MSSSLLWTWNSSSMTKDNEGFQPLQGLYRRLVGIKFWSLCSRWRKQGAREQTRKTTSLRWELHLWKMLLENLGVNIMKSQIPKSFSTLIPLTFYGGTNLGSLLSPIHPLCLGHPKFQQQKQNKKSQNDRLLQNNIAINKSCHLSLSKVLERDTNYGIWCTFQGF